MGKSKNLKAAKPVKVRVNWTVSKDNITLSGTEASIIEAKQMAEWAERELFPLEAVGDADVEDRIAPIGGGSKPDEGE
jgi:hypothetical protein